MSDNTKKIYFTYEMSESGKPEIKRIVTITEDGMTQEDFDSEKHLEVISNFFQENGVSSIEEAEEKGIFGRFDEKELNKETLDRFLGVETSTPSDEQGEKDIVEPKDEYGLDDDEEYVNDEELEEDNKILKRVGYGVLAGATALGIGLLFHSCTEQQIDEAKEENEDDLYKNMTEEQKEFFEDTFKVVEEFNDKTTKEGNFKLDEDKTDLHLTVDEAVALRIILNDYTADELYNVFGTLNLDTTNVMDLARSAYSKLSTYYMNAKEASGLSQLIEDADARAFFEKHENAVIEYNNNPSSELSDKVINGLYYDYTYGGATGEYAKIENNGVAWFATSAEFGFSLANRNATNISNEGIKLSEVLKEVDKKSLCASATEETREVLEGLRERQQLAITIISVTAKQTLEEELTKIGAASLANEVKVNGEISQDLADRISGHSASANTLLESYREEISSIYSNEAKIVAIMELAQEKFGLSTEIDLADLVNNRFRSFDKKKEPAKTQTGGTSSNSSSNSSSNKEMPTVDKEKFDSMTKEEQKDYIIENGKVTSTTTTTKEEKVEEKDLTEKEKEEVKDQKEVLKEIETLKNKLITQGVNDAVSYTDEAGAYKYSKNIVIPYNNQTVDTNNMSVFNIVAYASAFGDGATEINSKDAQIQARMNSGVERVTKEIDSLSAEAQEYLKNEYGSNWREQFIKESYKEGYTKQIDGSLSKARELGATLKKEAKDAFDKAQAEVDKLNSEIVSRPVEEPLTSSRIESTKESTASSESVSSEEKTSSISDPNLDPNYSQADEIPYVAPSSKVSSSVESTSSEEKTSSVENTPSVESTSSEEKTSSVGNISSVESTSSEEKTSSVENTSSVESTSSINVSDPNLDTNYSQADEIPFVVREVEEPLHYISDQEWEAAYVNTTEVSAPAKTK